MLLSRPCDVDAREAGFCLHAHGAHWRRGRRDGGAGQFEFCAFVTSPGNRAVPVRSPAAAAAAGAGAECLLDADERLLHGRQRFAD